MNFQKRAFGWRRGAGVEESSGYEHGRSLSATSNASNLTCAESCENHEVLCIWVKEARHLLAADENPETSDPFVRIEVGKFKYETRVVPRNRFPMWQQRFLVPLDRVYQDEELKFALYDRDLFAMADYLGETMLDMQSVVDIAKALPENYIDGIWHNVKYKRGTQGALCLGFQLLTKDQAQEAQTEISRLVPDQLPQQYDNHVLQVVLHSLTGFKASGLGDTRFARSGNLLLRIKVNNSKKDMVMDVPKDFGYGAVWFNPDSSLLELPIRTTGFRTMAANTFQNVTVRSPYEPFDLKIYLMHKDLSGASTILAKSQIPLWAIPNLPPGKNLHYLRQLSLVDTVKAIVGTEEEVKELEERMAGQDPEGGRRSMEGGRKSAEAAADSLPPTPMVSGVNQEDPEPLGREFTRIMEPYLAALMDDLALTVTVAVLPKAEDTLASVISGASEAPSIMSPSNDDVEEVDGAEPVPAPEPLEQSVLECDLNIGVAKLQHLLFGGYTDFMKQVHANEKLESVEVAEWQPEYGAGATRKIAYTRPITVPMAPPKCDVTHEENLIVSQDGGFVAEIHVRTTAPMGENFYVRQQLWAATLGLGKCRLRITMQVVFEKLPLAVRPLKGTITKASSNDSRKCWCALVDSLRHKLATESGQAAAAPGAAGSLIPIPQAGLSGAGGEGGPGAPGWVVYVLLGLMALLLLMVMRLGGQVKGLQRELQALGGQVAAVGGSCAAPGGR